DNIYIIVKESIIRLVKSIYPDTDVFAEEISKTDFDEDSNDISNYFFIDLIPISNTTVDLYTTDCSILIDIVCYLKSEKNSDYLDVSQKLDDLIRPVFRFKDRAITIYTSNSKIVDHTLHYSFSLNFNYTSQDIAELPNMEELYTQINERA
ncbi:MAG: translation initiation factor 2, partial [Oscillospiraceae bacterium]